MSTHNSPQTKSSNQSTTEPTTQSEPTPASSSDSDTLPEMSPELIRRTELAGCVKVDRDLTLSEREVTIRKSQRDDAWRFHAEQRKFIRGALQNTSVTIDEITVKHDDGSLSTLTFTSSTTVNDIDGDITAVSGTIPSEELIIGGSESQDPIIGAIIPDLLGP